MESFFFCRSRLTLERVLDGLQSDEVGPAQWSLERYRQSADDPFAHTPLKQAKAGVNGCGVATLRGAAPIIWRISFDQGGRDCDESIAGCAGPGLLSQPVCPAG
jgi:hypothetical protein